MIESVAARPLVPPAGTRAELSQRDNCHHAAGIRPPESAGAVHHVPAPAKRFFQKLVANFQNQICNAGALLKSFRWREKSCIPSCHSSQSKVQA
jgi:hypothetical protein